jgi:ADP-ribosyl-[dinitrogen reductase] hydrolase
MTCPKCLRYRWNFREGLSEALDCGGDTDTLGAIAGALIGASVGAKGTSSRCIEGICEGRRSANLLAWVSERLAHQKASGGTLGLLRYFWPALIWRNTAFLLAVPAHRLRRLPLPH